MEKIKEEYIFARLTKERKEQALVKAKARNMSMTKYIHWLIDNDKGVKKWSDFYNTISEIIVFAGGLSVTELTKFTKELKLLIKECE